MKKYILSCSFVMTLLVLACSNNEVITESNAEKNPVSFSASLNEDRVMSRADEATTPLNKDYVVGLYNKQFYNDNKSYFYKRSNVTFQDGNYTFSPTLYWDDISTDEYDVRKSDGPGIAIWAAHLSGRALSSTETGDTEGTGDVIIHHDGTFKWNLNTSSSDKNDLLVANYTELLQAQTTPINLDFHHVMTKITVNLIAGEGYSSDDFENSSITLLSQNSSADIDMTKAKGSGNDVDLITTNSSSTSDISMNKLSTANNIEGKTVVASFEFIVAPGKTINNNDEFATIIIGTSPATNTYSLKINNDLLNAWDLTTDQTLKYGTHYVLNATVNKAKIDMTASINDWNNGGTGTATGIISFTADTEDQGSSTNESFNKAFKIYTANNNDPYIEGSIFTYNGNNYTSNPVMYWNNNNDEKYFRALTYQCAEGNSINKELPAFSNNSISGLSSVKYSEDKDLLWGTSGDGIYQPTTKAVKLTFKHSLSKIAIKLATSSDPNAADAVDLTNVSKVDIIGTITSGGTLNIGDGTITNSGRALNLEIGKNTDEATATSYTCEPYLVLPQAIDDNAKILITMNDGSTFTGNLKNIHNESLTQSEAKWESNNYYKYTITLQKSKVTFSASVADWSNSTGNGNANMDWD